MSDLETRLRRALDGEAATSPPPHDPEPTIRRTRRRQFAVVVGSALSGALAVAVGIALVSGTVPNRSTPAATRVSRTINGITITLPDAWSLIDPDAAGLNGPADQDQTDLPRLVLAVSPKPADDHLACPGLGPEPRPAFLLTVQQTPLALSGEAATAWPVEPHPLPVGTGESACYPDWEFQRAAWTAAGRSFEARIGFARDIDRADREALFAAFRSMRFEPMTGGPASVSLAEGTTGGEHWQLTATRQRDGLVLSLEGDRFAAGMGATDPMPDAFQASKHAIGDGSEVIVFGVAPANVARVQALAMGTDVPVETDVLDIPDEIDARVDAFVLVVTAGPDDGIQLTGFNAAGNAVVDGTVGSIERPVETPMPAGDALEDGRHFGYIRSVDVSGRTIAFDLAIWLSGDAADKAFQDAGGEGQVPNDYFVVNDNPRIRTLALSPDLRLRLVDWKHCCGTFFDGDLTTFARAIESGETVTEGRFVYKPQSSWWITVRGGVVTEIEEQFTP
jgi:hypothetical protein